jgi:hypothetical protein
MWRSITIGAAVTGTALLLVLPIALRENAVHSGENGTFASDCCGIVRLSDGKMLLNDKQTIRYAVAADADGPYILPQTYVGVVPNEGFDVDGTRSVRKLRLDKLPGPTTIVFYEGLQPYIFRTSARSQGNAGAPFEGKPS